MDVFPQPVCDFLGNENDYRLTCSDGILVLVDDLCNDFDSFDGIWGLGTKPKIN
jgi:hypothetical protein